MNKVLAMITARGGSKRIPRKNIRPFHGKPIIQYSIEAALESGIFSDVMVSTEDEEIADISRQAGAEVPFMRSMKNADDQSTTVDVCNEVLREYEKLGKTFDLFCCIYPTAPFITAEKLRNAYALLSEDTNLHAVMPVTEGSWNFYKSFKRENGLVSMNFPEHEWTHSQTLDTSYYDCAQFYFLNMASYRKDSRIFADRVHGMVMPELEVQDIDYEHDWRLAELKYEIINEKNS